MKKHEQGDARGNVQFIELEDESDQIERMSSLASAIVREHYDPIIGKAQNDYMIERFQSPPAIRGQLAEGARYYFIVEDSAEAATNADAESDHGLGADSGERNGSCKGHLNDCWSDACEPIGFLSYYLKGDILYLSKFYLHKSRRGRGYSRRMLGFLESRAREAKCDAIELNVNRNNPSIGVYERIGFTRAREEKNDIGNGFFMDDYVYRLTVE